MLGSFEPQHGSDIEETALAREKGGRKNGQLDGRMSDGWRGWKKE